MESAWIQKIQLVGVDCAVDAKRVGLARATYSRGFVGRIEVHRPQSNEEIVEWIAERARSAPTTLLALDAPLGWPAPLGRLLGGHRAGRAPRFSADSLFRRRTDVVVRKRIGKQTLDVGADRIARTAVAALELLESLRSATGTELPLAWVPDDLPRASAIETYPAAWLLSERLPASRYKDQGQEASERREVILERVRELTGPALDVVSGALLLESSHVLDALLCVLCGVEFLLGRCLAPAANERELARKEGWIWFPMTGDLP